MRTRAFALILAALPAATFATGARASEIGPSGLRIEARPSIFAKKTKSKKAKPAAAPHAEEASVVETTAFDSRTGFEAMVQKSAAGRDPASIKPKARVIALRRELGLTRVSADQAPQDIVLSGGTDAGLSEGMTLTIMRKVPVLDPYRDNKQLELEIPYGIVRLVSVQKDVAVARLEKMDPIQKGLAIGTRGVFVGDYVGSDN